jgi:hypothetical protein
MFALLKEINVPEVLKISGGLNFLLAVLAFGLIYREQNRPTAPRRRILSAIYIFIAATLFSLGLSIYASTSAQQHLQSQKLQIELQDANTKLQKYKEASVAVTGMANTLQQMLNLKLMMVGNDGRNDPDEKKRLKATITALQEQVKKLSSLK